MHAKLFASLQETFEKWVEKHCEEDEFNPKLAWSNVNFALNMTKAAALVFDAQQEAAIEAEENTRD